jgi:hypothetical protein
MFRSSIDLKDSDGNQLITSYALHRPDGNWSLMLINRDEANPHTVSVVFENPATNSGSSFSGPVRVVSFGSDQYVWHDQGPKSHADPDNPPVGTDVTAGPETTFTLPKASITVLRGHLNSH